MSSYLVSVQYAAVLFPAVAFVFTVPFLLRQYKKFGAVPLWRTATVYSFILYGMIVYFLTILPLPTIEHVAQMTTARWSLVPLASVWEYIGKHGFSPLSLTSWAGLLTSDAAFELTCNILMFVPLGLYLRYLFNWNARKTLCAACAFSLFLELTQLSGLYGVYPRPYRLFDVDDLLNNPLGAMAGWALEPLAQRVLPTQRQLDALAYRSGARVPVLRRFFSFCVDWLVLLTALTVCGAAGLFSRAWLIPAVCAGAFLYFVVLQWALGGTTPGKSLVRLRIESTDAAGFAAHDAPGTPHRPRFLQLCLREGILYGVLFPSVALFVHFLSSGVSYSDQTGLDVQALPLAGAIFFGAVFLLFCIESLMKVLGSSRPYWYDAVSRTRVTSTIRIPSQALEELRRMGRTAPKPLQSTPQAAA